MAHQKMNRGWLVALIVAIVILVHLAVANYFLRARFEPVEVEDSGAAPFTVPVS